MPRTSGPVPRVWLETATAVAQRFSLRRCPIHPGTSRQATSLWQAEPLLENTLPGKVSRKLADPGKPCIGGASRFFFSCRKTSIYFGNRAVPLCLFTVYFHRFAGKSEARSGESSHGEYREGGRRWTFTVLRTEKCASLSMTFQCEVR